MADPLRAILARALDWSDAHATFDHAVADFPADLRGVRAHGVPWSAWQLVEHIRIAQQDILEFSLPGSYQAMEWPREYWPREPEPPGPEAWDESIATIRSQRARLKQLAEDESIDLTSATPHGSGSQTYARSILLVIDHTAYHVGQIVLVRRLLGAWR